MLASERLVELGIELPLKTAPLGAYLPAKRWGSRVFTSGQLPIQADGKISPDASAAASTSPTDTQAARTAVLNALAAITALLGHVDEIREVVRLMVYVNSSTAFTEQAKVANGASELLLEIFGDNGRHVRSAVGVAALPMNAAVEVELVVGV